MGIRDLSSGTSPATYFSALDFEDTGNVVENAHFDLCV
jgi:hypothetical protein